MFDDIELSDTAKMIAWSIGYTGAAVAFTYLMYKSFACMVGKAVASELVKAGVIAVL